MGLAAGGASAQIPFGVYSLNGTYLIEAHGFQNDNTNPTDTGENAILGLVTLDGRGGVSGVGLSFSHADNFPPNVRPTAELINCSLAITGGSYAVNIVTGAGTVTMTLTIDAGFPGGAPLCTSLSPNASLTFAFVLNDTVNTLVATSAPVQLIGFTPNPLVISGPPVVLPQIQEINAMVMTGTLRLR